ncbi:MAG: hypothetical protein ACRC9Z_10480 [Weissella confusa]
MALSDVTVAVSVSQTVGVTGYGIPAIFTPGTTNSYAEYETFEASKLSMTRLVQFTSSQKNSFNKVVTLTIFQ